MIYTLHELGLVDSAPESSFDNLTKLASNILGAPVSLVSIVDFDGDRQVFKSQIGLGEPWASKRQTPLSHSFCQHVVLNNEALVVENASEHALVKDNLAVRDLNVAAYLGMPVYSPNGQPLGALCVIDNVPRSWSSSNIENLTDLARCVSDVIGLKGELLTNERLRQEQRDFAYGLSHDLKAPVNTLNMLIQEFIEDRKELKSDEQTLLNVALSCAQRITTQIEAISRYTRTLKMSESHVPVDLNILCSEILSDLHTGICATQADIDCGQLPTITANRAQMNQLFQSLLTNALTYQPVGQQPVINIHSSINTAHRFHEIHISDNGIGIASEHLDRIFRIFGRLHTQQDHPGAGIGLTLCRRVAINHGGSLRVSSVPGSGSTFTLRLAVTNP